MQGNVGAVNDPDDRHIALTFNRKFMHVPALAFTRKSYTCVPAAWT